MAYTTANFNLVNQTLEGTAGTKLWRYTGTDSLATVLAASYVTDGVAKGLGAGDTVIYDKTDTVNTFMLKVSALGTTAATLKSLDVAQMGSTTSDTISFFGATAVSQPTTSSEAAVGTTAATTSTPFGFSTLTQANAIVTLVNQLRADLVSLGLIRGS